MIESHDDKRHGGQDDGLSLRWVLIMLTTGIGAAVAASTLGAGVVAALTTAAELLGVLPEVFRRCKHEAAAERAAGLDAPLNDMTDAAEETCRRDDAERRAGKATAEARALRDQLDATRAMMNTLREQLAEAGRDRDAAQQRIDALTVGLQNGQLEPLQLHRTAGLTAWLYGRIQSQILGQPGVWRPGTP